MEEPKIENGLSKLNLDGAIESLTFACGQFADKFIMIEAEMIKMKAHFAQEIQDLNALNKRLADELKNTKAELASVYENLTAEIRSMKAQMIQPELLPPFKEEQPEPEIDDDPTPIENTLSVVSDGSVSSAEYTNDSDKIDQILNQQTFIIDLLQTVLGVSPGAKNLAVLPNPTVVAKDPVITNPTVVAKVENIPIVAKVGNVPVEAGAKGSVVAEGKSIVDVARDLMFPSIAKEPDIPVVAKVEHVSAVPETPAIIHKGDACQNLRRNGSVCNGKITDGVCCVCVIPYCSLEYCPGTKKPCACPSVKGKVFQGKPYCTQHYNKAIEGKLPVKPAECPAISKKTGEVCGSPAGPNGFCGKHKPGATPSA